MKQVTLKESIEISDKIKALTYSTIIVIEP